MSPRRQAVQTLEEIGVRHAGRSKQADGLRGVDKQFHHSFVDPSKAKGTEAEVMDVIRTARDEIETEMTRLLRDHS